MRGTLLLVEDDPVFAGNLSLFLQKNDWRVRVCGSAEEALPLVLAAPPDIILADHGLPGLSGIEFLRQVSGAVRNPLRFIMITSDGKAHTAVEAMKAGAYDYLTKPVALSELKKVLDATRSSRPLSPGPTVPPSAAGLDALIGNSPAMQSLKQRLRRLLAAEAHVGGSELPAVLICGETGTGKELVARCLHRDGPRRAGPFIEINCAAIPAHLLEAELFGHEKGAFTDARERRAGLVEAAEGGTLFLDEIGEVDVSLQAKLLKLLEEKTVRRLGAAQERKVDLRIVSATNRDLGAMVRQGLFRSDLYFRLRLITLEVPPLRARAGDVALLAHHYLGLHCRRYGRPELRLDEAAERLLLAHDWPGNVRELRNLLEQAVLMSNSPLIGAEQLALGASLTQEPAGRSETVLALSRPNGPGSAAEEGQVIVAALEKAGWNVSKAARLLGMSRDMLRYRLEKRGLLRPRE